MTGKSRVSGIRRQASRAKVSTLLAALLVLVCGLAFAIPRPQGTPSRGLARRLNIGKSYALLIGNQAYQHLPALQTPEADVRSLSSVLQNLYNFDVTLLLDADRSQMIDAFDSFVERLEEADRLLIYYAGHGHQDEATGEGYWLPVTALSNRRSEWVANNTIRDTLKATSARHVLVVADSCFAGTLTRQAPVGVPVGITMDRYFEKLSNQKSRTALTSGGLEPVDDAGGGGHSVFAGALLKTLQENPGPILEASKLFSEIKRPVMLGSSGIQQPLFADIRQTGHQDGEFLFFRTQSSPVPPASPDPSQTEAVAQVSPPEKGYPPAPSKDSPQDDALSKGSPEDEIQTKQTPRPAEVLEVVQTSRQVRSDLWDWEIHLEGPEWALDEVRRVVYHLHPTFRPPQVEVTRRDTRFELRRSGWGTFEIRMVIEYRDETLEERRHQLRFR